MFTCSPLKPEDGESASSAELRNAVRSCILLGAIRATDMASLREALNHAFESELVWFEGQGFQFGCNLQSEFDAVWSKLNSGPEG